MDTFTLKLLDEVERIADKQLGTMKGHVTLFRFTTGWKVLFGTPELNFEYDADSPDPFDNGDNGKVARVNPDMSLKEALQYAILVKPNFRDGK